ncbi:uro-adherence factor A-like [Haliotis asinina]|uniref:uro-adherence factor A-like n=1 Tax=Haliotis asinina TaxID=109174 RepID=UPI0035325ABE
MRCTYFTNIVSCLALLYLLWGLYTMCTITSYLILCLFVIYHFYHHGQESGADYVSENFNMDRLYEERRDFFIKLMETLNRLNCSQPIKQVIQSLHNDGLIPNGCATAAENSERPVSHLTGLTEGVSQQLPRSPGNTVIDLETNMTYQGNREVSTDNPYTESEHSDHDLSCSDLEEDSEAQSQNGHAASAGDGVLPAQPAALTTANEEDSEAQSQNGHAASAGDGDGDDETVPKTVISVDKAFSTETDGSLYTNTDDESKALEDNQETVPKTVISEDMVVAAETEGSVNTNTDDESKALEDNQETVPKTVISEDMVVAAETEGSVDTNTDDESKTLADSQEAFFSTVISVDKPLPAESKANDSDLAEDGKAEGHNGHAAAAAAAAAAEPKNTMIAETQTLVDINTDDESTVLDGNSETIQSSSFAATKPEKIDRTVNVLNNNAAECFGKQSILKVDSDSINMAGKFSITTKEIDREVSLSRSNSPTCLGKEENSKEQLHLTEDTGIYGKSASESRAVLPAQPAALNTGNDVSSKTEEATHVLSCPRENNQESGPQQEEFHKPQESCVLIRHQGNTCLFSPTDDPGKLQSNLMHSPNATLSGLVLSHTYSLEDNHDNKTAERSVPVNLQNNSTCDDKKPPAAAIDLKDEYDRCSEQDKGCLSQDKQMNKQASNLQNDQTYDDKKLSSTPVDPKDEHDRYSEQEKGCLNQDKNMTKQDVSLQKDDSSDLGEANYTPQSDPKDPPDRRPDQDNGCEDRLPPSSHEASAELRATKLKVQKKQRVMADNDKEQHAPPDGRPSAKDKTPKKTDALNENQPKYDQDTVMEVSMSLSARFHQNGNQPVIIQQNQPEKWPTESSSDSENESKGNHSAVPTA